MGRIKKATTAYPEPAQAVELKALSLRLRVPMSELIREGLRLVFEHARAGTLSIGQPRDE